MDGKAPKKVPIPTGTPEKIVLALESRGFCAYISRGKTGRSESQTVEEFLPHIQKASIAWIDYVLDDIRKDAPGFASALGFSDLLVRNLLKNSVSGYEDLETEMGLLVPAIVVEGFDVRLDPLIILMRKNLVVTIHTSEAKRFFRIRRYAITLLRKLPPKMLQADKMTVLLVRIIDENNARNFDHLQEIEKNGDTLSQQLSDSKVSREAMGKRIYEMKHALIMYLSGLWATVDTLSSLRYGDATLITDDPKVLGRISGLIGEVHAQIGLAEHLSDVLASGLEVLQSIYNNQLQLLNNRLALLVGYLTIIGTAVLVPNTIATALSNPAFDLGPKDAGWYVALLIVSTLVSTWLAWWAVRKMDLLPKGPDIN